MSNEYVAGAKAPTEYSPRETAERIVRVTLRVALCRDCDCVTDEDQRLLELSIERVIRAGQRAQAEKDAEIAKGYDCDPCDDALTAVAAAIRAAAPKEGEE